MATEREIVVITGSSGLIGSAVANRLHSQYHVIGFDRPGAPHPPAHIECIDFDVASDDSVRDGLAQVRQRHGARIASVIHLAAYYDFSGDPSDKYESITVRGTERLIRELRRSFQVEQFVFSSTMLVHAPGEPGQKITEDSPIEPTWAYPQSKVWAEKLIEAERDDIPVVFLRIAGVYDDGCHSIPLANQIKRVYEETFTSHFYPADPDRGQSFVHLDDLVEVFPLLLKRRTKLPPVTPLLIGEPETVSYGELQDGFGRLLHGQKWTTYPSSETGGQGRGVGSGPSAVRPRSLHQAVDDRPRGRPLRSGHHPARSLLGWAPRHSLRADLPVMVEALKRDPARWYRANKLEPPKELAPRPEPAEGSCMSAPAAAATSTRTSGVWPHAANAVLGLWLATAPATFGPHRAGLLWSEVVSGVLIVVLSAVAWMPRFRLGGVVRGRGRSLAHGRAAHLLGADAAAYAMDTLTGTLVIAFAILVPGSVGTRDIPGPDTPPGWSYNPSAWPQRAGIIALAIIQFFAARHLAAYQLGHVAAPWDPFFGEGTQRVLDSDVSRAFPVSDAGLGAFTFLLEALAGFLGGTRRWRTMPWAVMLFGVLVVPVGVVSIVLVILQPLAVGAWCSLCLFTAS